MPVSTVQHRASVGAHQQNYYKKNGRTDPHSQRINSGPPATTDEIHHFGAHLLRVMHNPEQMNKLQGLPHNARRNAVSKAMHLLLLLNNIQPAGSASPSAGDRAGSGHIPADSADRPTHEPLLTWLADQRSKIRSPFVPNAVAITHTDSMRMTVVKKYASSRTHPSPANGEFILTASTAKSAPDNPRLAETIVQKREAPEEKSLTSSGSEVRTTGITDGAEYFTQTKQPSLTLVEGVGELSTHEQSALKELLEEQKVVVEGLIKLKPEQFINDSIAAILNNTLLSSNSTITAKIGVFRAPGMILSRELEVKMTPKELATGKMEEKFKAQEESRTLWNPRNLLVKLIPLQPIEVFDLKAIYDKDGTPIPKSIGDNLLKLRDEVPSHYQKKVSDVFDGPAFSRAFTQSESSKLTGLAIRASEELPGLSALDRSALTEYASGNSAMAQIITADGDPLYGVLAFDLANGDKLFISSQDAKNPFWLVKDSEWKAPRLQHAPSALINDEQFKAWFTQHLSTKQHQNVVGFDRYGNKVIQFVHLIDPDNKVYLDGAVVEIDATRHRLSDSVTRLKSTLARHHIIALDDGIITTKEFKDSHWDAVKMEVISSFIEMGVSPCFRVIRAGRGAFRLLKVAGKEVMENVISSLPTSLYSSYVNGEPGLGTNILNTMLYGSLFSGGIAGSRKIAKTYGDWSGRYRGSDAQNGKVPALIKNSEVVIHRAKSPCSEDLARNITPEMYADNVAGGQLQRMGRGYFEDSLGNMYLHVGSSNYVRLKSLGGPESGRFRIVDRDGKTRLLLRYDNNQFRAESLGERLHVIRRIGLSGRGQGPIARPVSIVGLIANLQGQNELSAQNLLDKYNLPEDGVFSGVNFANHFVEKGEVPGWAGNFEVRPPVAVSPEKTLTSITRISLTEDGIVPLAAVTELKLGAKVGNDLSSPVSVDATDNRFVIKSIPVTGNNLRTQHNLKLAKHEARSFERYYGTGSAELYHAPGGELYIRMRRVPGTVLNKITGNVLPSDAMDLYEAMELTLYERNIMHDDLNSGNVLWDADSQAFYPIDLNDYTENYQQLKKIIRGEGDQPRQRTPEAIEKANIKKTENDKRMQELKETNLRIIQEHLYQIPMMRSGEGNIKFLEGPWILNDGKQTALDIKQGEMLAGKTVVFTVKSVGGTELNFPYPCKTDGKDWSTYRWIQEIAIRVNNDKLDFALGEKTGGSLEPQASSYRNGIWVPVGRDGKAMYSVSWKITSDPD